MLLLLLLVVDCWTLLSLMLLRLMSLVDCWFVYVVVLVRCCVVFIICSSVAVEMMSFYFVDARSYSICGCCYLLSRGIDFARLLWWWLILFV